VNYLDGQFIYLEMEKINHTWLMDDYEKFKIFFLADIIFLSKELREEGC